MELPVINNRKLLQFLFCFVFVCGCLFHLGSLCCSNGKGGCCILCQSPAWSLVTLDTQVPHRVFRRSLL